MPNTISNFLVGIGFDFDEKSTKKADANIDRIKSNALQVSAVLAGAFGIKALTSNFADATNTVSRFSEVFGVVPNEVAALGRALTLEGGTMAGLMAQIDQIESLRAGLLRGDAAFIAQAGIAGIDPTAITNAKNATEAYVALGDQFKNLSQQQRINAADALGLDEASIRLLSKGSDEIRRIVGEQQEMRPITDAMIEGAKGYDQAVKNLGTSIGGFADNISETLLPAVTDSIEGITKFLDVNRELINSKVDEVTARIADNFELIAGAGAILTSGGLLAFFSGLARYVPIVGGALGGVLTLLGRLNVVAAAGFLAYEFWNPEDFEKAFNVTLPDWLKEEWFTIGGKDSPVPSNPSKGDRLPPSGLIPDGPNAITNNRVRPVTARELEQRHKMERERRIEEFKQMRKNKSSAAPQRVIIENTVNLDGEVIDRKIVDVSERLNQEAIDDLKSSEGG